MTENQYLLNNPGKINRIIMDPAKYKLIFWLKPVIHINKKPRPKGRGNKKSNKKNSTQ